MRVGVYCKSPLLQKSLELFLQHHLSSIKQSDVVVADTKITTKKPVIYIGNDEASDIKKPFSRSQFYLALEKFYKDNRELKEASSLVDDLEEPTPIYSNDIHFMKLQHRIDALSKEYTQAIMAEVKKFHEKR